MIRIFTGSLACCFLTTVLLQAEDVTRPLSNPPQPGEVRAPIGLPPKLAEISIEQRLDAQAPANLTFADETGKTVRLGDYFGDKPIILTLVYYRCPNLCDQTLNGLLDRLRHQKFKYNAGKDFTVLAVSFDPREKPELAAAKKENYMLSYGRPEGPAGWHFLTGEEPQIRQLAESVGFRYRWEPDREQYAHASALMILTPQGKVSRYFMGLSYNGREMELAIVEASQGQIGTPVDRLMLFCFPYDGVTGKYTLSVLTTVRLAGVLTVLVLLAIIVRAVRRGTSAVRSLPTVG